MCNFAKTPQVKGLKETNFEFTNQEFFYRGKVRDVYFLDNNKIALVASDRISAFDHILPAPIPYKGQILNSIAKYFLDSTQDILPNWSEAMVHPSVIVGKNCAPVMIEVVVRGYLTGHAWRTYKSGLRVLCGVTLPEGMKENEAFPSPIITPSTKAIEGHDEDISREEIFAQDIVDKDLYEDIESKALALFEKGTKMAAKQNLILVDTKYEFGVYEGQLYLIDEIHTPDSSRYFYKDTYKECLDNDQPQRQLSKEFVREWLMENGFQGKEGQKMPVMDEAFIKSITARYEELHNLITGKKFKGQTTDGIAAAVEAYIAKNNLAD